MKLLKQFFILTFIFLYMALPLQASQANHDIALDLARSAKLEKIIKNIGEITSLTSEYILQTADYDVTKVNGHFKTSDTLWKNYQNSDLIITLTNKRLKVSNILPTNSSDFLKRVFKNNPNLPANSIIDDNDLSLDIPLSAEVSSFIDIVKSLTEKGVTLKTTKTGLGLEYVLDGKGGVQVFSENISLGEISGKKDSVAITVNDINKLKNIKAFKGSIGYVIAEDNSKKATKYVFDGKNWVSLSGGGGIKTVSTCELNTLGALKYSDEEKCMQFCAKEGEVVAWKCYGKLDIPAPVIEDVKYIKIQKDLGGDYSSAQNNYGGFYNAPNYPNNGAFAAIKKDGTIKAWGNTSYGGSGAPTDKGYVKIFSNNSAFAALKADGSIKAWGNTSYGGSGAPTDKGYVKIFSNYHSFAAIKEDGSIKGWGGAGYKYNTPADKGYIQIYSTQSAFAAIKEDGSITSWGFCWNSRYQRNTIMRRQINKGYIQISSTSLAFAALKEDGSIISWGDRDYGGTSAPTDKGYVKIFSTGSAFAALKADGSIKVWGDTGYGGSGAPTDKGYVKIFSTNLAFAALKEDGSIISWGNYGRYRGKNAPTDKGYIKIFSTNSAFAAIKEDGSIYSWGDTSYGGNGAPVDKGYVEIFSVGLGFAALKDDGSIKGWGGAGYSGARGVAGKGYVKIFSTAGVFIALKEDGSIRTWAISYPNLKDIPIPTDKGFIQINGTDAKTVTNSNGYTINGTASKGSTVELYENSIKVATGTADEDGKFSISLGELDYGKHSISAIAIHEDRASNETEVYSFEIKPDAPKVKSTTIDTISGTAVKNSTVDIYEGTTKIATTTTDASGNFSATLSNLTFGSHIFTAFTTANGSKSKVSESYSVTFIQETPVMSTVSMTTTTGSAITIPCDNGCTNTRTQPTKITYVINGTASKGTTVKLYNGTTNIATVTTNSSGKYSIGLINKTFAVGTHNLSVKSSKGSQVSTASKVFVHTVNKLVLASPSMTRIEVRNSEFTASLGCTNGCSKKQTKPLSTSFRIQVTIPKNATKIQLYEGNTAIASAISSGGQIYFTKTFSVGTHNLSVKSSKGSSVSAASKVFVYTVSKAPAALKHLSGLIVEYKFEGNANDTSGNNRHGTKMGSTSYTTGKNGKAAYFPGNNSSYIKGTTYDFASSNKSFTMSAWVYSNVGSRWGHAVAKGSKHHQLYMTYDSTGKVWCGIAKSNSSSSYNEVASNQGHNKWVHITFVRDASGRTIKQYINGTLTQSKSMSTSGINSASQRTPLEIGTRTTGWDWFKGKVDDVRVYNRALSATEVKTNMNLK